MKLDINQLNRVAPVAPLWAIQPLLNRQELSANTWVQLVELPSDFSHDEALLLCQLSADEWVAWVPQYGETVLHTHQFRAV